MYFNPNRVSRVERQAFQLVGDKTETKVRQHKQMTAQERECYWTSAVRKAMAEVKRAN